MNMLTKVSLVLLLAGLMSSDLMAQRGGRGQSGSGNRMGQSAQPNRGQADVGQKSRGRNSQAQNGRGQNGQGQNGQGQNGQGQNGRGQAQSGGTITEKERSELVLMREEEKLARDVYVALNKKWGETIFTNIARAESKHMQAIAGMLAKYRIPDPVVSNTPGSFTNPRFQQLYQSLVRDGSSSLESALKVGLTIEEMDIADLRVAIQSTSNNDIRRVYQNLEQGSMNHLRAFSARLKQTGGVYVSSQLSQTEFDNIANSSAGRGGSQGNRGNNRQGQVQRGQGNGQRGQGNAQTQRGNQAQGQGTNQGQQTRGSGQRGNQGKGSGGKGRGR